MSEGSAALRSLPAVGALLDLPAIEALSAEHGRPLLTQAVRIALEQARAAIKAGASATVGAPEVERVLRSLLQPSQRRVLNGTGVVLHTNLGRAPLHPAALEAITRTAGGYSNLELDLSSGERGERHAHVAALIAELTGAEAGMAVNNCAGAVLLMLAALGRGREVIVARGELIEIGGGFRVPDVMAESGVKLVEVGTTNKVYAADYERAVSANTAAILSIHRSNFAMLGFVHQPALSELAGLAQKLRLPLLVDLGSGLLARDDELGEAAQAMKDEPRAHALIDAGADLIAFSGDKLLGGPQAGLLAGKTMLIERAKRHPLARALRADKLTLLALEATLSLYRAGRAGEIPTIRDLALPYADVARRAEALAAAIRARVPDLAVDLADDTSRPGGGSLPLCELPTRVVLIGHPAAEGRKLASSLRGTEYPVVTRVVSDRVALDARTIDDQDVPLVALMVENARQRLRVRPEEEK